MRYNHTVSDDVSYGNYIIIGFGGLSTFTILQVLFFHPQESLLFKSYFESVMSKHCI